MGHRRRALITTMSGIDASVAYRSEVLAGIANVQYMLGLTDKAGTTTLTDQAGNGYTATASNVTFAAGPGPFAGSKAPYFNGTSSKIDLLTSGGFAAAYDGNEHTISLFAKGDPSMSWLVDVETNRTMLMFYADANNQEWYQRSKAEASYNTRVYTRNNGTILQSYPRLDATTVATWFHVLLKVSDSGDVVQLKINNTIKYEASGVGTRPGATPLTEAWLGVHNGGAVAFWWGYLSHMVVVGRYTTPEEDAILAGPFDLCNGEWASSAGAWSFYSSPMAIRSSGKVLWGSVDVDGDIRVGELVASTQHTIGPTTLKAALEVDDHAAPGLLVRDSDSKLVALYCKHNDTTVYGRVSTNALDTTAWDAEADLDASLGLNQYCYTNLVQLTGETDDPIYDFFRARPSDWGAYYAKSTDGGATWGAGLLYLENAGQRPYVRVVGNGTGRIDICYTDGHPNEVATNSVYHAYYLGGAWYKSDGTLICNEGDLPFAPSDGTLIWDGSTAAGRGWVWDIAIDGSGNPVVVYAVFPSTSDHRYRYARWTGSAWSDHEICAAGGPLYAGEAYYSGGVALDPEDVNTVYASRESGGTHTLWRLSTGDNGSTWNTAHLTTVNAFRPVVVRNHGGQQPRLLYLTGTYTSYTNYATSVRLRDG